MRCGRRRRGAVAATDHGYWKVYYDADTLARAEALREEHRFTSTGVTLHADVYPRPETHAPVLVLNHGGGGYCRLFVRVALALHARGWTLVLPDQCGQGYSEGDRGDFTLPLLVQNVVDAAGWARARFAGDLLLAGGSIGGALAYYAAAAGAPVRGMVCHNLYDFGTAHDALAVSRLAWANRVPPLPQGIAALNRLGAALLPGLKLPFGWLGAFETMVDEREAQFYALWQRDPYPIRAVSLRYLASMASTPPAVPLEHNWLPVLVLNPLRDRMVAPAATRRNYERLGGPKSYAELDYGHWAMGAAFAEAWAAQVDGWYRRGMSVSP